MLGRAGRFGYDTEGIGYIMIRNEQEYEFVLGEYFRFDEADKIMPKYSELVSKMGQSGALQELILLHITQNLFYLLY